MRWVWDIDLEEHLQEAVRMFEQDCGEIVQQRICSSVDELLTKRSG